MSVTLAFFHAASRSGGVDIPQCLHEGGIHLYAAVGDGQVL